MIPTLSLGLALLLPQDPPVIQDPPDHRHVEVLPIPRMLALARRDVELRIDGTLLEWPDLPPIELDHVLQLSGTPVYSDNVRAWRGPGDLSAKAFLLWDRESLYFACVVMDDWHRPLDESHPGLDEVPPADSIVLSIDPRRDTRAIGPDRGREEDREYWLADMDIRDNRRRVVLWNRYRSTAAFSDGASQAVARDPEKGLTTYEARIPWREILPRVMDPVAGLTIDMQIVISDYDEITDPMAQTRIGWTFGSQLRIDPGLYAAVMLVDDFDPGAGTVPGFPPPPELTGDPVPPPAYWTELAHELGRNPPAVFDGSGNPQEAGGFARFGLLEELERRLAEFPRADYLELLHRTHRRMPREVVGMTATGLPYYWGHVLVELAEAVESPPPDRGFRLYRLPQGGFLVHSAQATFAIDPVGHSIDQVLWEAIDFVILTQPLDLARRNDDLLVAMGLASPRRPMFTHLAFHLPTVLGTDLRRSEIGKTYEVFGLRVKLLGRAAPDGKVPPAVSYEVRWPDGTLLVVTEPIFLEEFAPRDAIDGLILSARHPRARIVGQRLRARLTVLDDLLTCSIMSGPLGRIRLADGFALQRGLLPHRSIVLAPGESVHIAR